MFDTTGRFVLYLDVPTVRSFQLLTVTDCKALTNLVFNTQNIVRGTANNKTVTDC